MDIVKSSNLRVPLERLSIGQVNYLVDFFTITIQPTSNYSGETEKTYYHYSKDSEYLYLPKHTDLNSILQSHLFNVDKTVKKDRFDSNSSMFDSVETVFKPRNEKQVKVLEFLDNNLGEDSLISLSTGSGKTIISILYFLKHNLKPVIMCHNNTIIKQWVEKMIDMGIPEDYIGILQGSKSLNKLKDKKIIVASTPTMASKTNNPVEVKNLVQFFNDSEIDLLIVDEGHKLFNTVSRVLMFFNFYQTIILTATPVRSMVDENKILSHVYPMKNDFQIVEYEQDIDVNYLTFNSSINQKELNSISLNDKYRFDKFKYVKYLMKKPNNSYFIFLDYLYETCIVNCKENEKNKALIVGSTIEQLEYIYDNFKLAYPELKIKKFYGNYKKEKEHIPCTGDTTDIILSIGQSVDAGFDEQDLTILINLSYVKSESLVIQLKGRLARTFEGKKKALYLQPVDLAIPRIGEIVTSNYELIKVEGKSSISIQNSGIILPMSK